MVKTLLSVCLFFGTVSAFGQITSLNAGAWETAGNWDCNCVPDEFSGQEIRVNHAMTISSNISLTWVRVNISGSITINSTFTVNITDDFTNTPLLVDGSITNNGTLDFSGVFGTPCQFNGTLTNSGTVTIGDATMVQFKDGSSYIHSFTSGGAIPIATWQENSTCEIQGMTAAPPSPPTNLNQPFENFTWNTPSMGAITTFSLGGLLTTVNGNLRIISTNAKQLHFANGGAGYNLTIQEDFLMDGGVVFLTRSLGSNSNIDVKGNFSMSGGTMVFSNSNTFQTNLHLKRNFSKTSGSMTAGSGTGSKSIIFDGNGTSDQTYATDALAATALLSFTVESNAILDLGTNAIVTTGTAGVFTVNGTLKVGSTNSAGAIETNIPITSRTFNSGSKLYYNNSLNSQQFMGAAQPSGSGVSTFIQTSGGVTFESSVTTVTLDGPLTLLTGNISIPASKTLVLNGNLTAGSNSIGITTTSNLSIGGSGTFTGPLRFAGGPIINDFSLNRSGATVSLLTDLTVNGAVTFAAGILDFAGLSVPRTLTINGPYTASGGTLTPDTFSVLTIAGAGSITGGLPLSGTIGTFTLSRSPGISLISISVANRLNLNLGVLNGAITMSSGATVNRGNGSFDPGVSLTTTIYNLEYTGTGSVNTGAEVDNPIQNLTMNATGGVITMSQALDINGTLTMTQGTLVSGANDINLAGNLVNNGGNTSFAGGTLIFDGNTTLSGSSNLSLTNITIASGATLNLGSTSVIPIINISGNVDHDNGGTMIAGTSTVRFNGTTTIVSNTTSIPRFNNLVIASGSSLALNCIAGCGSEPTQYSIEVSGSWLSNLAGATFNPTPSPPTGARVILNGASQAIATLPSHTFFDLYLSGVSTTLTLSQALNVSNDLVINAGTTLNTGTDQALNLGDDFIINGTFVENLGTVNFIGSSGQNIDQSAGTPNTTNFYNIVINKGGGAFTFGKNVNLIGSLAVNSATTIDFDGSTDTDIVTLVSTQSRTAVVLPVNGGATPNGTVHAQRYMDAEGSIYRYISSPVGPVSPDATGPRAFDLQGEVAITGPFTGNSFTGPCVGCVPCTGCVQNNQSMFLYNETLTAQTISLRYANFPLSANTEQMIPGKGYAVFVRSAAPATTIDLRGRLTSGNVTLPVTYSGATADDGWNLVGNPYASPIDWDPQYPLPPLGTEWTRTNITPTIYTRDNGSGGVYATYNNSTHSGTNGGSRYIATGQGFWVRTTGASPSLVVTEAAKANQQPTFFKVGDPANTLRVTLAKGLVSDEALIHFGIQGSSSAYDPTIDSYKLVNTTNVDFYSISSDDKPLTINAQPGEPCGTEVKLGFTNASAGAHRINIGAMETFTEPLNIYLQDQFTGISKLITTSDNFYDFQVTTDPNSKGSDRFKLVFSAATLNTSIDLSTDNVCAGSDAIISLPTSQQNVGYKALILGTTVSNVINGTGGSISITIPNAKLTAGINQVTVQASAISCGPINANLAEIIPVEVQTHPTITSVTNASNCGPGQVVVKANTGSPGATYKWFEGPDAVSPIAGQSGPELTTPFLNKTKTYYVSAATAAGCEGSKTSVNAIIVNFDPVEITETGGMLKSSYVSGNQWFLNGAAIAGATSQTIVPTKSGLYKVETTISGCKTSTERTMAVTAIEDTLPQHMSIYPNPTSGQIQLEVNTGNAVQARIVTTSGVILHEEMNDSAAARKKISFDLNDQADGLYILRVQDGASTYSTRLIKKK